MAERVSKQMLYDTSGDALITTWTIENPDGATAANRLKLTQNTDGALKVYTYEWNSATSTWSLAEGNDRVVSKSKTTENNNEVETETISDGSGTVSSVIKTTYKNITCNDADKRVEIEKKVDPDGAALTTVTDYYEEGEAACDTANCGLIESQTYADGSWVKYEYYGAYSSHPRQIKKEVRSWLDQPIDAPESSVRVINYSYDPVGRYDVGSDYPEYSMRPRSIIETIAGQEVSREYYLYYISSGSDVVLEHHKIATIPGADYYDDSNREATTYTYLPGTGPQAGRIESRTTLDGTTEAYAYETGTCTSANPVPGTFTAGSGADVCVTVTHPAGDKTTRETVIRNDKGEELARETFVKVVAEEGLEDYERVAWSVMAYDDNGRVTDTWQSDGAHTTAAWNCCHKESETDIYGLVTQYTGYDDIGRLTRAVRNNIATDYTYDAVGRRLSETVSADGLTLSNHNTFDTAGRPDSATDSAGLLTDYVYNSPTITTIIRPGGAAEVTETYLDGRIKSITGAGVAPRYYTYGVNTDGSKWTREDMGSPASPRYEITTTDMAGNIVKIEKPGYAGPETTTHTYCTPWGFYKGHLLSSSTPGLADMLYEYDELGNVNRSGLDVDDNGYLEDISPDRIQESDTAYAYEDGAWWQTTTNRVLATNRVIIEPVPGSSEEITTNEVITTGIQKTRLTGLGPDGLFSETVAIDINGNQTISRTFVDPATHTVIQTVDYPDSSINEVTTTVNGQVVSQRSKTGVLTTFSYDGLGRRIGVTDPRTGTAVTHYNLLGQVDYVQDPAGNQTAYAYDPATGRQTSVTDPLGKTTWFAYNTLGLVTHKWGSAVEPVKFVYDAYGQMVEMHMFRNGSGWDGAAWPSDPGDPDITTWNYQEATGLLIAKEDDDGQATTYTYTLGGKLLTRTWARQNGSLVTTYGYDPSSGELISVDYSDDTPDVSYTYTRGGQLSSVNDAAGARTFTYNSDLRLNKETINPAGGGLYGKTTITRTYDAGVPGRSTGFKLPGYSAAYGYDAVGRMNNVTWNTGAGDQSATYAYVPNSDLLDSLTMGGLTTDYAYEPQRNVKTQVKHTFSGTDIVRYDYTYNAAAQRGHVDPTPDLPDTAVPTAAAVAYTPDNLNQYDAIDKDGLVDNPVYDDDGNLITAVIPAKAGIQSPRQFTWDGENRLVSRNAANPARRG